MGLGWIGIFFGRESVCVQKMYKAFFIYCIGWEWHFLGGICRMYFTPLDKHGFLLWLVLCCAVVVIGLVVICDVVSLVSVLGYC